MATVGRMHGGAPATVVPSVRIGAVLDQLPHASLVAPVGGFHDGGLATVIRLVHVDLILKQAIQLLNSKNGVKRCGNEVDVLHISCRGGQKTPLALTPSRPHGLAGRHEVDPPA